MKKENTSIWLKEGKQTKMTPEIRKIADKFKGNEFEKIKQILEWMDKNLNSEKDHSKVLKIFATRTADQLIKEKNQTGCHDTAMILVTFLRAVGIPARYLFGISKTMTSRGGHCIVEAYTGNKWILIDPSYFQLNLKPERSHFYKEYHIIKKGLDSWGCGIKTHADWKKVSDKLIKHISNFKAK